MAKEKLKIAFYWAASCGGCEVAVLDVNEKILDVVAAADIVFWPVAIDTKYKDVEAMPDKYIDACFFNGAIRTEENEKMAKLLGLKKGETIDHIIGLQKRIKAQRLFLPTHNQADTTDATESTD